MEDDTSHSSRRSTRAQAAPDWTSSETLTLINETSAVDRDCRNAIASFQKWSMVSKNIAAVGFHRSLDQCRRKWVSLLESYKKVKELGSFWNLDDDVRAEFKVSHDFDLEVFKAMDEHLTNTGNKAEEEKEEGEREIGGLDPDTGADYDVTDGLMKDDEDESGIKRQKNHPIVRKKRKAVETMSKKPKEAATGKTKAPVFTEEVDEEVNHLNEQKMLLAANHQTFVEEENEGEKEPDNDTVLAEELLENAKSVEAIANEKFSYNDYSKEAETEFIRHQGDQLIEYLGKLAQTLKQLRDVAP